MVTAECRGESDAGVRSLAISLTWDAPIDGVYIGMATVVSDERVSHFEFLANGECLAIGDLVGPRSVEGERFLAHECARSRPWGEESGVREPRRPTAPTEQCSANADTAP